MNKPKYLIIHHTGISYDKNPNQFNAINSYHKNKGWGQIGYHFVIEKDGPLKEGRGQDQIGAHCRADGMNYKSLGIALTGNFQIEHPTEKQLKTLRGIIGQLREIWKIPAENVLGHKEVQGAKTACPGTHLSTFVKTIRKVNNKDVPEAQDELLEVIKEQRQEISRLKTNYKTLQTKYQKKLELIEYLKVALGSNKSWITKLLERIKKNDENT